MLLALSLFAMLILLAMATNMGSAVNDRIRMQSTADLSTYAVAYSEAASLNALVEKNRAIADAVDRCRSRLEHGFVPWSFPCLCSNTNPQAEIEIQRCKLEVDEAIYDFTQAAQYDRTVGRALAAGRATAQANFDGTERRLSFFENESGSPTARGTYKTTWSTNSGASGTYQTIADFTQADDVRLNYAVIPMCGSYCTPNPIQLSNTVQLHAWFYKDSSDPDIWVAGRAAGTPENRYLDTAFSTSGSDGGFFGASSTGGDDLLVAYAVAKPYDGSVGPTKAGYAQRNATTLGMYGVYSSHAVDYPRFAMVEEYRARFAGIQDSLGGSTTPRELIERDAYALGRPSYDMDRFKH